MQDPDIEGVPYEDATPEELLAFQAERIKQHQLLTLAKAEARGTPTWLIPDFLVHPEFALWFGAGGTGKSTLLYHMAGALAGGYPVFDAPQLSAQTPQRCLIVSAEDPPAIVANRILAFAAGHGWDVERVSNNLRIWAGAIPILTTGGGQLDLVTEIRLMEAAHLFLDPLTNFYGHDHNENDNVASARVTTFIRQGIVDHGVSVHGIHHPRKGQPDKDASDAELMELARGGGQIANAARAVYRITTQGPEGLKLQCVKSNFGSKRTVSLRRSIEVDVDPYSTAWDSAELAWVGTGDLTNARALILDIVAGESGILSKALQTRYVAAGGEARSFTDARNALIAAKEIEVNATPTSAGRTGKGHFLYGMCL